MRRSSLHTSRGPLHLPAYVPVTTFGGGKSLDDLVRPYLVRLAPALMVSPHYASEIQAGDVPHLPLLVDSGGFASIRRRAVVEEREGLGVIVLDGKVIEPESVLALQERLADVAYTLDLAVPLRASEEEVACRERLTIANAMWALAHRRRADLKLFATIQATDAQGAHRLARLYARAGFDGVAVGGLVPRSHDKRGIVAIVEAARDAIGDLPLHVFGLGHPTLLGALYAAGADLVDSSSYARHAVAGTDWASGATVEDPSLTDRLQFALNNYQCGAEIAASRR